MRRLIISEEQEKILAKFLKEEKEIYQMPVDKKANKPYCINPEKVLIVKNFLDKSFSPHDYEKIGADGMPVTIKVISMNAANGEPLKYMYQEQIQDLLIDRFQKMFNDKLERELFMKQVLADWLAGKIGPLGTLSTNRLLSENMSVEEIETRANEADTNPTDAQKEAGNYKLGHISVAGMPISIENPKGSKRRYKNEDGTDGYNVMKFHYGYFKFTDKKGKDGDAIDVFVGPHLENITKVYVVDQNAKDGSFDESKVMLGFDSIKDAKEGYMANYGPDWKGFRCITGVPLRIFKQWLYRRKRQRKPFADYVKIRKKRIVESKSKAPLLTESNYKKVERIATMPDRKAAIEVAEDIQSQGIDAFVRGKDVFVEVEYKHLDPKYSENAIRISKKMAQDYRKTHPDIDKR